jgi:hypothetical protein
VVLSRIRVAGKFNEDKEVKIYRAVASTARCDSLAGLQDCMDGMRQIPTRSSEGQSERPNGSRHFMRLKHQAKSNGLPGADGDRKSSVARGGGWRSTGSYLNCPAKTVQRLNGEIVDGPSASFSRFCGR